MPDPDDDILAALDADLAGVAEAAEAAYEDDPGDLADWLRDMVIIHGTRTVCDPSQVRDCDEDVPEDVEPPASE